MIKIVSDISEVNIINQAAGERESNPGVNYCDVNKHPIRNEYAIPIIEPILRSYNLEFISDEWLSTDIVEQLAGDWSWPFQDRPIRVIIPLWVQANAITYTDTEERWLYLKQLLLGIMTVLEAYTLTDKENVTTYLEELYAEHIFVLEMFDNEGVKIETK